MGDRRDSPPRQLPLAIRDFTGRAEHLAALDALLVNDASAVVISALDGTAGVGKTTLAVHWAHRVQERHFPDGTLYVNLRGYGPGEPATPAEVLDGFIRAFDITPERIPIGVEAQAALYRSLVAGQRVLIVLDNANAAEQLRPLLPGTPGCLVLVTSRDSLTGLVISEAASRVTLDLLSPQEATDLVWEVIGEERASVEPDAVAELTRVCARLPLALRIAAARVNSRPYATVSDVLSELSDDRMRLDLLSASTDDKTAVRAVFDWSYRKLTAEQGMLFRRLGLHPGPEVSVYVAAAVSDFSLMRTRGLLDQLAAVHLIEPVARDRYRFHDLLRAYANECASRDESSDEYDHAIMRLLSWYARTAEAACLLVFSADFRMRLSLEDPPHHSLRFAGRVHAVAWVDRERENLIAATHQADVCNFPELAMSLADNVGIFLYRRARWDDALEIQNLGLTAAQGSGSRRGVADFLLKIGEIYSYSGCWQEAWEYFMKSLIVARQISDPFIEAYALNDLGLSCLHWERNEDALGYFRLALSLIQGKESGRLAAVLEGNLAVVLARQGEYEDALEHATHGHSIRQRVGDKDGESKALQDMAGAWQGLGNHSMAMELRKRAVEMAREYTFPRELAGALQSLGDSLWKIGDRSEAETCWQEAKAIFDEFSDQRAENIRRRLAASD